VRRFVVLLTVVLASLFLRREPTRAQFYQQRSQAAPAALPSVNYIGVPGQALPKSPVVQYGPAPVHIVPRQPAVVPYWYYRSWRRRS
jgi:hypothetical protein